MILLTILATYYASLVLTEYDGPFLAFEHLRNRYKGPLECFVCLAPYVALPMSILATDGVNNIILYTVASAGGAVFLNKLLENLWSL